ncbi:tetratricopeptide repeat protein [uncultured Paraglaciecola sp.]|uniref:tetratricopeptide repeat protein n=1 Tax=uncultured Paraglaciecola sp. TaxID=1765024 RepID=UPI0025986A53|nr:tetratricopeptide repeat protein [uncultured Paraglaciecola sp.]
MNQLSVIVLCLSLSFSAAGSAKQATAVEQATAVLKSGDTELAIELLKKQDDDPQAMLQLAKIYIASDLDEAEDWIEKAAEKQTDNAEIHYWRGRIMGSQAQNSVFSALSYAGKSLDSFTLAVELKPDSVLYRNALMQFHLQAPGIAGGDVEIAKQQVLRITELDVKAGLKAEIDYAFAEDDELAAQQLLNDAMLAYEDIPDFYFDAGMIQQRQEHYSKAFEYFTQAISKKAEDERSVKAKYSAFYQLGKTSVLSEQNIEAGISALQEYVANYPDLEGLAPKPWAQFRLANLLALNGQKPEAKNLYQELLESSLQDVAKGAKKALKKM